MNTAGVANALYLLMSFSLVASGLVVVATAVRGFQVIVYRRGVFALGTSLLLLVAGWVVSDLVYYEYLESWVVLYAAFAIFVTGAAVHLYAVWRFARDFVRFGGASEAAFATPGEHSEGFDTDDR